MNTSVKKAYELLREWKGGSYVFGLDVLEPVGEIAARMERERSWFPTPHI